ncbi:MAG: STAS domain-containing protein [Planctomycetota bacterium]|jgi:anti-anti-sigma factor
MSDEGFNLEGSKLTVAVDLEAGREDDLRRACEQLLGGPGPEYVVDLSEVRYIHSLSVGMLSYAWVEALSRDREMKFLVSQEVAEVLERTGLSKVFAYEVSG